MKELVRKEIVRQLLHLFIWLVIAGMVFFFDHLLAMALLAVGLFSGLLLIDLILRGYPAPFISHLLKHYDRCDPLPGKGALFFAGSTLACVVIFPARVVVPALVTIAVLDSVTTIVGTTCGKTRIYNGKSVEGAAAGMAATAAALLPLLPVQGSCAVAVFAGLIELVSPLDDNLLLPPSVCCILFFVPVLL